jgi:5'(3')-deoxyribonucleotidase
MDPIENVIESNARLSSIFDIYILSTEPWDSSTAWTDKLFWVKTYLGNHPYKRLMLFRYKNLHLYDYLVDDRTKNGVGKCPGEHIQFGTERFPNWCSVIAYPEGRA